MTLGLMALPPSQRYEMVGEVVFVSIGVHDLITKYISGCILIHRVTKIMIQRIGIKISWFDLALEYHDIIFAYSSMVNIWLFIFENVPPIALLCVKSQVNQKLNLIGNNKFN